MQPTCAENFTAVLHRHLIWKPSYQEILYPLDQIGIEIDTSMQESSEVSYIEQHKAIDFTRAQQADFNPSICCVNNHGKRGCWNNSNILFKTFPSCYNANLMTLTVLIYCFVYYTYLISALIADSS